MVNKYPDFWHVLLGDGSVGAFLAFLLIAYTAATVSLLIDASNRDISSTNTPVGFSWKFLWAANTKRLIANFLAIPLLIRVSYEKPDMQWMILISIGYGVLIDRAAMFLKNLGVLSSDKAAARVAQKLADKDPIVMQKDDPKAP